MSMDELDVHASNNAWMTKPRLLPWRWVPYTQRYSWWQYDYGDKRKEVTKARELWGWLAETPEGLYEAIWQYENAEKGVVLHRVEYHAKERGPKVTASWSFRHYIEFGDAPDENEAKLRAADGHALRSNDELWVLGRSLSDEEKKDGSGQAGRLA